MEDNDKIQLEELKIILAYNKISSKYKGMPASDVEKKISLLERKITKKEQRKKYEDLVKNSLQQNQSISHFSEKDQEELVRLLKLIKKGKHKESPSNKVTISKRTIEMTQETSWETLLITILYDNLEDIKSYKLGSYYYDCDEDPRVQNVPTVTKGNLGKSLGFLIKTCKELTKE